MQKLLPMTIKLITYSNYYQLMSSTYSALSIIKYFIKSSFNNLCLDYKD